jgi:hypothetical protein
MFGSGDLDVFFADFGSTVIAGSQTAKANFDSPGQAIDLHSLAPVSGVDYAITFKSTALSALAIRQQITVDGNPFQVTAIDPLDDGQITKATLKYLGAPVGPGAGAPAVVMQWGKKLFNETADGARTVFTLPSKTTATLIQVVADGMVLASPNDYSLGNDGITVTFVTAPPAGRPLFVYA